MTAIFGSHTLATRLAPDLEPSYTDAKTKPISKEREGVAGWRRAILAAVRSAERFGLELPDDFPLDEAEILHECVRRAARGEDGSDRDARREYLFTEWLQGLGGVYIRFRACADHDDQWRDSIATHGLGPPFPERYVQERALYGFFSNGLSSLECIYYGLCFVGELVDPVGFRVPPKEREITPRRVASLFRTRWPDSPLSEGLHNIQQSEELVAFSETRNVLSHRAAPARHHFLGGNLDRMSLWRGQMLSPETTAAYRRFIASSLTLLVRRSQSFISGHART